MQQPKKKNPFNNNKFEEDKDDAMQIADKPMAEILFSNPPGLNKNVSQGSGGHIKGD